MLLFTHQTRTLQCNARAQEHCYATLCILPTFTYTYNKSPLLKKPPKTPPLLLLLAVRCSLPSARRRPFTLDTRTSRRALETLRSMKRRPALVRRKRCRCVRSFRSVCRLHCVGREVYSVARPRCIWREGRQSSGCSRTGRRGASRGVVIWVERCGRSERCGGTVLSKERAMADTTGSVSTLHH